jgi:hypothetical protein
METTTALLTLAGATLAATVAYLWRRSRRLARSLAEAARQTDEAARTNSELATLVALGNDTNHKLACQLYGQVAVDRAIRQARNRGVS